MLSPTKWLRRAAACGLVLLASSQTQAQTGAPAPPTPQALPATISKTPANTDNEAQPDSDKAAAKQAPPSAAKGEATRVGWFTGVGVPTHGHGNGAPPGDDS